MIQSIFHLIKQGEEMRKAKMWSHYLVALLLFNGCGTLQSPQPKSNESKSQSSATQPRQCGCTPLGDRVYELPTPQKEAVFKQEMAKVALSTKEDPNYKRLALDTPEEKRWFKELLYRLWDRQITREEFIKEGLKRFPDKGYEFRFIAEGFQRECDS